jgi:hypothetical protein
MEANLYMNQLPQFPLFQENEESWVCCGKKKNCCKSYKKKGKHCKKCPKL